MFKEIYAYRELLKTNVKKEIRGKYKASVLGVLWSFLNPLLQVVIYAIIFPHLMNTGNDYIVYLVTGIIPWTFFQTTISGCVGCIKGNAGIIKKVYFPRIVLPLSTALSGLVNFMISCVIILIFCIIFGVGIGWQILFVPIIAILQMCFSLGLGMMLGAMDAYVQDLEYIVNFLLNLAFYGSPIVYQMEFLGTSTLAQIVSYNPLTVIINSYRDVFLYHQIPSIAGLGYVALISLAVLSLGTFVFQKLEKGFAEQF